MSYGLRISPATDRQIDAQPEPLRSFIRASLDRLAQNPTAVSHRAGSASRGQAAEFRFDREGVSLWVTVRFLYGQDEQTLYVGHVEVEFAE